MHYDARVRFALIFGLLFFASAAHANARDRVELYTVGAGDELFSKFGHVAICVMADDLPAGGLCYNYGTSDFSRPVGLGWDVVRGRAKFWVSVSDVLSMIFWFQEQDRTVYRQVLPLSDEQVAGLRATLRLDARPENREYIYSHFLDNCSTRPRDLIDEATGGELRQTRIESPLTYRDYAREGLAGAHWALVPAGDLVLGRWVDQEIDAFEAMFIPRVLRAAVEERFDARPEVVYERAAPLDPEGVSGVLDALLARRPSAVACRLALAPRRRSRRTHRRGFGNVDLGWRRRLAMARAPFQRARVHLVSSRSLAPQAKRGRRATRKPVSRCWAPSRSSLQPVSSSSLSGRSGLWRPRRSAPAGGTAEGIYCQLRTGGERWIVEKH